MYIRAEEWNLTKGLLTVYKTIFWGSFWDYFLVSIKIFLIFAFLDTKNFFTNIYKLMRMLWPLYAYAGIQGDFEYPSDRKSHT